MQFEAKSKEVYKCPEYGTRFKVKKFALFPVTIGNKRIWLESYYAIKEFRKGAGPLVYDGLFVKTFADSWITVDKEVIFKTKKRRKVTEETKNRLAQCFPPGNKWEKRRVERVTMENAWYKKGQIIEVKYFATFGCYDKKDRWVNYYDLSLPI